MSTDTRQKIKTALQACYEQMKGRSTKVISLDELYKVIRNAPVKNRFGASSYRKSKEVNS